jgi:hypothetical protein
VALLAGGSALVLVLAGLGWWAWQRVDPPVLGTGCTATADGRTVDLDPEQAGNAATITAIAVKRGLPARAATIALATALQESKLRNVSHGDRDSLGLFQQRPSQGWGTKAQVMDPVYSANAFYDVLVKIEGYRSLSVTKAAQKVQRSAFPSAYADHEADARVLASALSGYSAHSLTCRLPALADHSQHAGGSGLTPRAQTAVNAAQRELGASVVSVAGSGRVVELKLPAANPVAAWAMAQWAVARADTLGVIAVTADGTAWSRSDHPGQWSSQGSTQLAPGHVLVQVS